MTKKTENKTYSFDKESILENYYIFSVTEVAETP
jgi:hypothetical protein